MKCAESAVKSKLCFEMSTLRKSGRSYIASPKLSSRPFPSFLVPIPLNLPNSSSRVSIRKLQLVSILSVILKLSSFPLQSTYLFLQLPRLSAGFHAIASKRHARKNPVAYHRVCRVDSKVYRDIVVAGKPCFVKRNLTLAEFSVNPFTHKMYALSIALTACATRRLLSNL